jgi:hypothetical protein
MLSKVNYQQVSGHSRPQLIFQSVAVNHACFVLRMWYQAIMAIPATISEGFALAYPFLWGEIGKLSNGESHAIGD